VYCNRFHGCSWKNIDKLFRSRKLNKHEDCFEPVSFKKTINLSSHISFGNSLSVPKRNILNFMCHFMAVSMAVPRKQANIYGTGKQKFELFLERNR
jgi:hypothetical protein